MDFVKCNLTTQYYYVTLLILGYIKILPYTITITNKIMDPLRSHNQYCMPDKVAPRSLEYNLVHTDQHQHHNVDHIKRNIYATPRSHPQQLSCLFLPLNLQFDTNEKQAFCNRRIRVFIFLGAKFRFNGYIYQFVINKPSAKLTETSSQVKHTFPKDSISLHVQHGILNRSLRYKEAPHLHVALTKIGS